ncbi:MAG: hypothetical protein ND895_07645 [Pyrinomonadaceae bacterium]|nr:hypothetical protein [Pyrinomonadaceae bacterium]
MASINNARVERIWQVVLLSFLSILLSGCGSRPPKTVASIEFNVIPPAEAGGADRVATISGSVVGARPGQQIVLFARSGKWWVQPVADQPFTTIQPDSKWTNSTHLGTEYAALLVEPGYRPAPTIDVLPTEGGDVVAVKTVPGEWAQESAPKALHFSGYEWDVRNVESNRGGRPNKYDTANAWTDESGFLHLRIARKSAQWTCAEVRLKRSLGYGSYSFVVRDTFHLEPAAVSSIFTWDTSDESPNHREMSIELARWGDAANKNGQYVVQPYYVPANVVRFMVPPGVLTHSFHWEPGKVAFRTVRGSTTGSGSSVVAEHVFTSGVPVPGGEAVHLNLYIFGNASNPLQNEAEVVIEKFEYLP